MRTILTIGLLTAALSAFGGAALAGPPSGGDAGVPAGSNGMTVRNTNQTMSIERVWVAPAGQSNTPWEEVTLDHPILPGEDSTFTVPPGGRCFYDVRLQFDDNGTTSAGNVNVCRRDTISAH